MRRVFILKNDDTPKSYGLMTFNGKFTFRLGDGVDLDVWNKIGFIPLDNSRYIESVDLFRHLNNRLPITLRGGSSDDKLSYIRNTGLRVVSDSFYLEEVESQEKLDI